MEKEKVGGIKMEYAHGTYGAIAHRDLNDAKDLCGTHPHLSVFSSQQACEKILKQYIQLKLPKDDAQSDLLHSHKLRRLAYAAELPNQQKFTPALLLLQEYYFDGRYPGTDYVEPDAEIARDLYEKACEIVELVDQLIAELHNSQTSYFKFEQ